LAEKFDSVLVVVDNELLENTIATLNFELMNLKFIFVDDRKEKTLLVEGEDVPVQNFSKIHQELEKVEDQVENFIWLVSGCANDAEKFYKAKKFLMSFGLSEDKIINLETAVKNKPTWFVKYNHIIQNGVDFFATGDNSADVSRSNKKRKSKSARKVALNESNLKFISGSDNDAEKFSEKEKFLETFDVGADSIINLEMVTQVSHKWFANFNYLVQHGADFFATGDEYICVGLNFDFIPKVITKSQTDFAYPTDWLKSDTKSKSTASKNLGGVNLADTNQTLQQSYWIPGNIQFVLIGLSPESFCCEDSSEVCHSEYLYPITKNLSNKTDLNFKTIKTKFNHVFSAKKIFDWDDSFKPVSVATVEKNHKILKEYIKLCRDNGVQPVGLVPTFAPAVRENFDQNILTAFREVIHQLEESEDFLCLDLFDLNLYYDSFSDMRHLNLSGNKAFCSALSYKLYQNNFIALKSFCDMTYEVINKLATLLPKEEFNSFLDKIFELSAADIQRKEKIKLGFVVRGAAEWCGDTLYNQFANDKHFEVTIFSFLELSKQDNDTFKKDFEHGLEQFKARKLNVVALDNINANFPVQDIIIFMSPYFMMMPRALRVDKLILKTLINYIPYSIATTVYPTFNYLIMNMSWRVFFSSKFEQQLYANENRLGMPHGFFSGYPRLDLFFQKYKCRFDWKMARPDAKKIIYAPHWSIDGGIKASTFQWNYQFMLDFAKNHPETSWVIKPHPLLLWSAVDSELFESAEEFEEYLQQWNDLPNAQVYTGAYYQAIFATSDGMIHDSGSFMAEYQYADKPMIFLTREDVETSELGKEILQASYLVDGRDLESIAATMQKVFIEGDDYKAAERKEVFDKYLNYPEYNGMLASEFIYKSIADEVNGYF